MSFIPDPFDSTEAISPSGRRAAKVFFAPVGTDPALPGTSEEWHQIGWAEPLDLMPKIAPPPPPLLSDGVRRELSDGIADWYRWRTQDDTPTNGCSTNE